MYLIFMKFARWNVSPLTHKICILCILENNHLIISDNRLDAIHSAILFYVFRRVCTVFHSCVYGF